MKTSKGCGVAQGLWPADFVRPRRAVTRMQGIIVVSFVAMVPTAIGQNLAITAPQKSAPNAQSAATRSGGARGVANLLRKRGPARSSVPSPVVPAQATQTPGANDPVHLASAVSPLGGAEKIRDVVDDVYQTAAGATTVAEIQQALTDCESLRDQSLGPENDAYLKQLQGWLLNRRGEAYAQAAVLSADAGRHEDSLAQERQAQQDFRASLEQNPHWRAYHNLGVSLAMTGEFDDALQNFSQAIELNPTYSNTRFNRAELWLELGQYELAEREYSEVLRLNADDVDSQIGRGHARFYMGELEHALEDFSAVIQDQPDHAVALADRADLHAYRGNWKLAAQDYRDAIRVDRTLGRAFQSAAWLMATCPDPQFRDDQLAVMAAERAISLDGQADYRYLDTLGAAQANAGNFQAAVDTVNQAMEVAPEDVQPELQQRQRLYQAKRPFRDEVR